MSEIEDQDMQILADHDRRGKRLAGTVALLIIAISAVGLMLYFGNIAATAP